MAIQYQTGRVDLMPGEWRPLGQTAIQPGTMRLRGLTDRWLEPREGLDVEIDYVRGLARLKEVLGSFDFTADFSYDDGVSSALNNRVAVLEEEVRLLKLRIK